MNLTAKKLIEIPPKPPRRWKPYIFGLLGLLCVIVLGLGGFLLMQSRMVDRQFALGNRHYEKALSKLDEMLDETAKTQSDKDSGRSFLSRRFGKRLTEVRNELDAAAEAFGRMKTTGGGWERRAAEMSLISVRHAGQGVGRLERRSEEIDRLTEARSKIERAAVDFDNAFVKANEAVAAGNEDKYDRAKESAAEADKLFGRSQKLLSSAKKVSAASGIDDVIPALNKARQWAQVVEKMVEAGAAGRFAEYNDLARENNRLSEEAADIARSTVLSDPQGWLRAKLEKVDEGVALHFNQADKWRDKALSLWGKNI